MAGPATANITLNPGDGWIQIVPGAVSSFFSIRHFPHHVPIFIAVGTAAPADPVSGGHRSDCGEFWANGALAAGTNVYVRISNNSNGPVSVSAYYN
jgi:hypothetical protein